MRKVSFSRFGGVEVLEMIDEPVPAIDDHGVLVQVKAVSINPVDWKIRQGEMKLMSGRRFPKGVGIDFSGIVARTGSSASRFHVGQAVFGALDPFKGGAMAEYVAAGQDALALKPESISFEQAAALPVAGCAALQVFDTLDVLRHGKDILINGAGGGIGMFAAQIARARGAVVTGVGSSRALPLLRRWGCDHVISYESGSVLSSMRQYDAVIDLSGRMPFGLASAFMKRRSVYVNVIPGPRQIVGSFFHNLHASKKSRVLLSKNSSSDLATLAQLADGGMEIVVGRTYPLEAFKQAYQEVPRRGFAGKAVVVI
ncbi:NAD(P)-dependent alcohol dehydrogenase [Caenimonas soli]|uniref:NAD(P)-dependent alcohol dehydrogenase n=1 Tax=Caenimonas soli TaxID=2735555 RepID=UPI001551BD28|nr:NAD(P)-dependent alcohol dehydrogenase [Caenimonas soli]NPC55914.1 NAD(P)-dependent alcohol dehydrogenase [Caenimonas soli]